MKTILITGGAGFIGSNLTKYYLEKKCNVSVIDNLSTGSESNIKSFLSNPNFHFYKKNVTVGKFETYLGKKTFDSIFHLASPASPRQYYAQPVETLLVNSIGTYALLEFAKETKSKSFIFASTSEVYGDPQNHPQNESYWGNVNPNGERSCYDEAKRFGEALVMTFFRKYELNVKIARIFNTYGPHMERDDGRVISNFITQALKNADLTVYGDGKQTRSFCYVDDLLYGLDRLSNYAISGSVINLGNDDERKIIEIANLVKKMLASTSKIVFQPLPNDDPKKRKPDLTVAKKLLSYSPQITLEKGLRKTISFFKQIE